VKTFRLWLLVLLAVLLPVRGALAAGMLCPAGSFGVQSEVQLTKQAHVHDDASATHHEHQLHEVSAQNHGAGHDHTSSDSHDHAGAADKCNLCSAFCSVTGLVSADVTFAALQPPSAVFPHLYAPPPNFVSDGQERPPRSI
jgi:hypothetical protein